MIDKIVTVFIDVLGRLHWKWLVSAIHGNYYFLTESEKAEIRERLTDDYYIILTRRKPYLSTYAINFSHWFLTRKWGYYGHSLMNLEDEVNSTSDFRLMEATNKKGVTYTPFDKVFDCDSVALLKPKGVELVEWTLILDNLKTHKGKKYDTLYDLADDEKMSCVELVRVALMTLPNYETRFANFEKMIAKAKNLDPHMFYRCSDFEIEYEVRH